MITNGAKPSLVEQTSYLQRSKAFTGVTDTISSKEQSIYWGSRQVILNEAKPLLADQTSYPQRSKDYTGRSDK